MAIDPNDEILQDFLVEAGELLETLNEQLIQLEQEPANRDLLNAVFRGFHTIKGGAGFLNLNSLVAVCHHAEDVFNLLRNGERQVDAALMDTILRVLDVLNVMFGDLQAAREPEAAPPALIEALKRLAVPGAAAPAPAPAPAAPVPPAPVPAPAPVVSPAPTEPPPATSAPSSSSAASSEPRGGSHDASAAPTPTASASASASAERDADDRRPAGEFVAASDDITDEEFEALLDALQGAASPAGAAGAAADETASPASLAAASPPPEAADSHPEAEPGSGDDLITDEEFEALLDRLHGAAAPAAAVEMSARAASANAAPDPSAADMPPAAVETAARAEPASAAPAPVAPAIAAAPDPALGGSATAPAASWTAEKTAETAPGGLAETRAGAPASPPPETSVRVDTQRLDEIMNLVGELVLVRNRMSMLRSQTDDDELAKAIGALALVTADLQTAVMKTRMQPIKKVFGRFPRVVRDLARSLGKEIELEIYGEETDLDKNLVEALADPLVHLVRNAVDHGIEPPAARLAAGKPAKGRVILAAAQEGDHIALIIEDDGRGMDPRVLRAKAVEKGLLDPAQAERLSDAEAFNLIFMAGFSTKEEISDVSGRGVGMDVVKNRIAQLNGSVEIDSQVGRGTRLQVRLPLTLAILPALMVILDGRRFAIPLASVSEILDLDLTESRFVDDQEVIVVRKHALPLYYVARWLRPDRLSEPKTDGHVVVVQVAQRKVGLVVDDLVGQEEVVIKPLGLGLRGLPGLAGATITGDGGIALILDVPALLRVLGRPGLGGRASRVVRGAPPAPAGY